MIIRSSGNFWTKTDSIEHSFFAFENALNCLSSPKKRHFPLMQWDRVHDKRYASAANSAVTISSSIVGVIGSFSEVAVISVAIPYSCIAYK